MPGNVFIFSVMLLIFCLLSQVKNWKSEFYLFIFMPQQSFVKANQNKDNFLQTIAKGEFTFA